MGNNGEGKTNLLKAIGYLATLKSFRGSPPEALVRLGTEQAVVRAEAGRDSRRLLIEAEIHPGGRDRIQVNRQPLRRARDLLGALQVTVFAPDDLALIKAGPQWRREYLDDLLVGLHPRHDTLRGDLDRVLRQRNALLKQAGGNPRPDAGIITTLDVWDQKLADVGTAVATAREELVVALGPELGAVYDRVAERAAHVVLGYQRSWDGPLDMALATARGDDLRRGVTTGGRSVTTWSSPSAVCPRGPTLPRANSVPWPSPCAWRGTSCSASSSAAPRCCYWTTCSPSSTATVRRPCWPPFLPARGS